MTKTGLIIVLTVSLTTAWYLLTAQEYPVDYFDSPVKRDIYLSGTFGELRPNHFHAGIDIKALNGGPGDPVYAAAGGYISRIVVLPGGYGNAIYISHPNGYTSVYAHLDRFIPEIADYVKEKQYSTRSFKVNLFPKPNQFELVKGDHIGYLGNSGGSYGPHLHFEIRTSAGQVPVNPFHFGLRVKDELPPEIEGLRVYYLDADHNVFHTADYKPEEIGTATYILDDTLVAGAWRVAFAVKSFDPMNDVPNQNGDYKVSLTVDDKPQFGFTLDKVSYSETRYMNAHVDYDAEAHDLGMMHRCFKLPGNKLDFYQVGTDEGIIDLYEKVPRSVQIRCSDYNGNESTLEFWIRRDAGMVAPPPQHGKVATIDEEFVLRETGFEFIASPGTFYAPSVIGYSKSESEEKGWHSALHTVGSKGIPLHKYCNIEIEADLPSKLTSKAYIAKMPESSDDELTNYGGTYGSGKMKTAIRNFGTFGVRIDTVPPTITPVKFAESMQNADKMSFTITDNVQTAGRANDLIYEATVDGKWILFEYDAKNDLITHKFDEKIPPGKHSLFITVTDDRRNTATFEKTFTR